MRLQPNAPTRSISINIDQIHVVGGSPQAIPTDRDLVYTRLYALRIFMCDVRCGASAKMLGRRHGAIGTGLRWGKLIQSGRSVLSPDPRLPTTRRNARARGVPRCARAPERIAFDWNRDAVEIERMNPLDLHNVDQIHVVGGSP